MKLHLNSSFINELVPDKNLENSPRKVFDAMYSYVLPKKPSQPKLIHTSTEVLKELGIRSEDASSNDFLDVFSGRKVYENTKPYAMAYAGHQFGHWAGQLGDGRAINLFQIDNENKTFQVQLKGAGPTPYSRRGDGFAVLRSSIREYLCSEAMHHLGVPTTRALSLMLTGDNVLRDILYNGNAAYEKGAIVSRVSPSFLRFGNFELFASRNDLKHLKRLADYVIKQHYVQITSSGKQKYVELFKVVTDLTLDMIIHWQRVGFVHGVMNTDNMSILGLTIDYGPYGWLEGFDFDWTPNTTDAENRRYRFGNQPNIALWNLLQLANALYPLVEDGTPFETILNDYKLNYDKRYLEMMLLKIGLFKTDKDDKNFIAELEECLHLAEIDMTIFFRNLSNFESWSEKNILSLLNSALYKHTDYKEKVKMKWNNWFQWYNKRLTKETLHFEERKSKMNAINPKYVLRNYMAQMAIDLADKGDYSLIDELFNMLKKPYSEQPEYQKWYAKRPEWARHKVGCSALSCSS